MELTWISFLIVCPLVFLGGFVDAIGGGGGLISLPAYLLAGVPTHMAIATNKLSSACGTALSTVRFIKEKLISLRMAIPTVIAALVGSFAGANLSLLASEQILKIVLVPILFVAAFFVMNKRLFGVSRETDALMNGRIILIASIAAFVIGMYDGFYGPGTGTFLIIVLNVFAHLSIKRANAQTKAINLTTNITSLSVFIISGQVLWVLGFAAALCGMLGNYLGSSLALKNSDKITRPIILIVLVLLLIKVVMGV